MSRAFLSLLFENSDVIRPPFIFAPDPANSFGGPYQRYHIILIDLSNVIDKMLD